MFALTWRDKVLNSRDGDTRVAVIALLVVTFVVDVGVRTVRVVNVRRYGR